MSWDLRDSKPVSAPEGAETPPANEPASPIMVPTLAVLAGLDDWVSDPLTLDSLPAAEQDDARLHGLVPPSQWSAIRRLMFRGIAEST